MMKAVHLSDTHGTFPELPKDVELVLHTGDFCPNFIVTDPVAEARLQNEWIYRRWSDVEQWLDGRTMLACMGNHDFTKIAGPNVYDISNLAMTYGGKNFYGFPWVPPFGPWSWGAMPNVMAEQVALIPDDVDVLLAHCPPYGILDRADENIGNRELLEALYTRQLLPKYLLCGHVHEQGGKSTMFSTMNIINSATTMTVIGL